MAFVCSKNKFVRILCVFAIIYLIIVLMLIYRYSDLNQTYIEIIKGTKNALQNVSIKASSGQKPIIKKTPPKNAIQCYRVKQHSLKDISAVKPKKGQSIFLHETSCKSFENGKITITSRQACAVESAAKMNPNMDVYLLFTSPGLIKLENTESDKFLKALLTYSNVKIHHVDYENYTKNTPVEKLYADGKIEASRYAQAHASDVLRYLTLYKYGGIYLDLDVVVVKSFENLPKNFAGLESELQVAAGIIGFSHDGVGHNMSEFCIYNIKENFSGTTWNGNGPGIITRLFQHVCGKNKTKTMKNKDCNGFTLFSEDHFYPIFYGSWKKYFDENSVKDVMKRSNNSYIHHMWNKLSFDTKIELNKTTAYTILAQTYCPRVYKEVYEYF